MSRPKLLDLYCCQGGASRGYVDAGFDVYGVDLDPQPRYPFPFRQDDALGLMRSLQKGDAVAFDLPGGGTERVGLEDFASIHASPPCQLYSLTHRINKSDFPDLIGPTRELVDQTGLPWVIENVMEAAPELRDPVMLCGAMFGIETYRHRLFETNWELEAPLHPPHVARNVKMGRRAAEGEYLHIVGNFTGVDRARSIMGMPWANRDGLREAIPVAYTDLVGRQLLEQVGVRA